MGKIRALIAAIKSPAFLLELVSASNDVDFLASMEKAVKDKLKKKGMSKADYDILFGKNDKVADVDRMINHVEDVLGMPGVVNYGNKKWEQSIKYLIEVKEKGWDFRVLWAWVDSEEEKFMVKRLNYGLLMHDPCEMLKIWMPYVHAKEKKQEKITSPSQVVYKRAKKKGVPNPKGK